MLPGRYNASGVLASGSSLAASIWGCDCGRCLRIALNPGIAFHSSLSFVEGSSDGLAAGVRALLDGCVSLTLFALSSVAYERSHSAGWVFLLLWAWRWVSVGSSGVVPWRNFWGSQVGGVFQFSLWIEYCWLLPCLPQDVLAWGCHGSLSWVSTSLVWSSGCFWLRGACLRPVVPLRLLASSHSGVCAMRSGVLPCSLTRCGTSWLGPSGLAVFASLPLVSRSWTVLSWYPLRSLSSVSDRLMVVLRQLVGLEKCPPASPNCPASRVRKQRSFGFSASFSQWVFAMRSPCRVGSVSVLDRNEGSSYTFLVFGRSLRDGVTLLGRVFSHLDRNEDS